MHFYFQQYFLFILWAFHTIYFDHNLLLPPNSPPAQLYALSLFKNKFHRVQFVLVNHSWMWSALEYVWFIYPVSHPKENWFSLFQVNLSYLLPYNRWDNTLAGHHMSPNKISASTMGYIFLTHWSSVSLRLIPLQDVVNIMGCPPQPEGNTLLLKTPPTYVLEHGEINLVRDLLIWKPHSYCPVHWKALYSLLEERDDDHSYLYGLWNLIYK